MRLTRLAPVIIVLAGVWAYTTSFSGVFVFDDMAAIARNPHLRAIWPPAAPPDTTLAGRPVATLTFALNYAVAPTDARETFARGAGELPGAEARLARNARGYHAVNLAIHLLAALTVFGVVRRSVQTARPGADIQRGAAAIATGVALLWVVHPLTTSAVTYLVQRVESLMGLLYLVTLYCAVRAHEASRRGLWMAGAVVACALGMATKEVMVTAPLAVMLWDWVFRQPWRPRFYAALGATWIILAALVATAPRAESVGWTIAGWTPWTYLLTQAGVILHYLRLVVYPSPLVLDYGWPPATLADAAVPVLLLLAAFLAALWLVVRRHPAGFAAALFFLVLAPSSSLLPVASEVAAEHRMYLPLAAVLSLVAAGAVLPIERPTFAKATVGRPPDRKGRRPAFAKATAGRPAFRVVVVPIGIAVVAAAVALGAVTRERNRDFANQEQLWQRDIAARPSNARARTSYGMALFASGRNAEAESHLRAAVQLDPRDVTALVNLGSVLCAQGRLDACVTELDRALALEPGNADALAALGDAHTVRGDDARAAPILERALAARPDDVLRLNRLGWLLAVSRDDRVRDAARALTLAERAVALTARRDVMSLNTLAAALAEIGRFDEAAKTMADAIAVAQSQSLGAAVPELERRRTLFVAGRTLR